MTTHTHSKQPKICNRYGQPQEPKHLTFGQEDSLKRSLHDLELKSKQFLLTSQGRKLHYIVTSEETYSAPDVLKHMYTTASTAISSNETFIDCLSSFG